MLFWLPPKNHKHVLKILQSLAPSLATLCAPLSFMGAQLPAYTDMSLGGMLQWWGREGSWVNTELFLRLMSLLVSCLSMGQGTQSEIAITQSHRCRQADRHDRPVWNEMKVSWVSAWEGNGLPLSASKRGETSVTETNFKGLINAPHRELPQRNIASTLAWKRTKVPNLFKSQWIHIIHKPCCVILYLFSCYINAPVPADLCITRMQTIWML